MDNIKSFEGFLDRMQGLLDEAKEQGQIIVSIEDLENAFPELKESEDERIRKNIIATIHLYYGEPLDDEAKEMLAWLEKQGETNETINRDKFAQGVLRGAAINLITWIDYNVAEGNMCLSNMECKDIEDALVSGNWDKIYTYMKKKLEKKGEKKSIDDLTPQEAMDIAVAKCFEQEQKPADKVEPKFKAGDWIIDVQGISVNQIIGYEDDSYLIKTSCSEFYLPMKLAEKNYRPWTIQDAKDGDVLCCESGWTCIFKALDNHANTFSSYCFMDKDKWFCNTGSECHTLDKAFIKAYNGEIHPATKEQRDILMKAMADAGYTFDFDKKVLKKIEQKPTDEEMKEALRTEYEKGRADVIAEIQKSAWSEEDEKMCQETIDWFEKKCFPYALESENPARESIKWLKSIKEHVQPQQKVEWGEEDERKINRIYSILGQAADTHAFSTTCRLIGDKECIELQDFLKSLKDRYTWKPSDKQLNALHDAAVYEHLNKLREK